MSRWIFSGIAFLACLTILVMIMNPFIQSLIYPAPPVRVPEKPPSGFVEPEWQLDMHGWLYQPESYESRQVLLYFHGNGENLETMRQSGLLKDLQKLQIPFLVVDYPGYGRSKGKPSERSILENSVGAVEWLNQKFQDHQIILCGWSLGGSVAVQTAAKSQFPNRLIAMSTWTSLRDVAEIHFSKWLVGFTLKDQFDALEAASKIKLPALLIHGELDDLIPATQGKRISDELEGPVRWILLPGVGHNDLLAQPQVWSEIQQFLLDAVRRL